MIHVSQIEVRGLSDAGPFGGSMTLAQGLQVISAGNAYGKSLAATVVVWCLGAEPLYGTRDSDLSCFSGGRFVTNLNCRVPPRHECFHQSAA